MLNLMGRHFVITAAFLIFIGACKSVHEDSSLAMDLVEPENIEILMEEGGEDFNSFFSKFLKDKGFRWSRIDNPLTVYKEDEPTEEHPSGYFPHEGRPEDLYIDREDFGESTEYMFANMGEHEKLVTLRGTDSGIYIEYEFERRDGKWYIRSMKDLSM